VCQIRFIIVFDESSPIVIIEHIEIESVFFELFTITRYVFRYITTVTNVYIETRIHNILLLFILEREVFLPIKKPRQDADLDE
jgi:hypothetical protein